MKKFNIIVISLFTFIAILFGICLLYYFIRNSQLPETGSCCDAKASLGLGIAIIGGIAYLLEEVLVLIFIIVNVVHFIKKIKN